MDAQAIQQVLNGIAAVEKGLTKHQIANRIEAERRRGDPEFSKACRRASCAYLGVYKASRSCVSPLENRVGPKPHPKIIKSARTA